MEWHFFATSHGKGAVDGVGGTVKRCVSAAILSRKVVVNNASSFAKVAEACCPNIMVILVLERDINAFTQQHNLESLWSNVIPLVGKYFTATVCLQINIKYERNRLLRH